MGWSLLEGSSIVLASRSLLRRSSSICEVLANQINAELNVLSRMNCSYDLANERDILTFLKASAVFYAFACREVRVWESSAWFAETPRG